MNLSKKTIKVIYKLLSRNKIKWAIVGSTNMRLQGIDIKPHDLDIIVQLDDLEIIRDIFSEYRPSEIKELGPFSNAAWEVKLNIGEVEVQILGEEDNGKYVEKLLSNKIKLIHMGEIEVPCFTLETEAQTYSETNRENKAKMIYGFLSSIKKKK